MINNILKYCIKIGKSYPTVEERMYGGATREDDEGETDGQGDCEEHLDPFCQLRVGKAHDQVPCNVKK